MKVYSIEEWHGDSSVSNPIQDRCFKLYEGALDAATKTFIKNMGRKPRIRAGDIPESWLKRPDKYYEIISKSEIFGETPIVKNEVPFSHLY